MTYTPERVRLWVGGVLGFAWFYVDIGYFALHPTSINWLMIYEDGAQHLLGWLFFRNEPWSFPLGALTSFCYPLGTTVGFTDSIPWVAILAKSLAPLFPVDFQYFGLWLGLCFFLQGFWGMKIVQELSPRPFLQLLGGILFIFDPMFMRRTSYGSLCAHWLILGLMWLHLRPCSDMRTGCRMLKITAGFCLLSAGIHPYLAAMVLALSLALLSKFRWVDRWLSTAQLWGWGLVFCGATLIVLTIFGYIGSNVTFDATGFGFYSADLLTLINPLGASHLVPTLPIGAGQGEGYGYLGGGVLVLSVVSMLVVWRYPGGLRDSFTKQWLPLGICCLLLAVFALSSTVTTAGNPIADLGPMYQPIMGVIAPFRVAGRFIWPLHYLWIAGVLAVYSACPYWPRLFMSVVLVAAVAVQIMDAHAASLQRYFQRELSKFLPIAGLLHMEEAIRTSQAYQHLVLYPPQLWAGDGPGCPSAAYPTRYFIPLAYHAYRLNMTINSGYVARMDKIKAHRYCQSLNREIQEGKLDENTVYVVHGAYMDHFNKLASKLTCGRVSDYLICSNTQRHDALREFLEKRQTE